MAIGNIWLGSLVDHTIVSSGNLVANSYLITSTSLSVAQAVYGVGIAISGACTEQMLVTYRPVSGANYSMTVYNTSTSGQANIFYRPSPPMFLFPGDTVSVIVKNTQTTGGVYGFITTMY